MAAERSLGLRYCGGCNPRYDRVGFVKRLSALLPEWRFEHAIPGKAYDAALVVCGCPSRCAKTEDLAVPPARTLTVSGFEELLPTRDKLRALADAEEGSTLSSEEVLALLPHRPPLLLVDRVTNLRPGEEAAASFYADPDSPVFQGHFPDHPVVPGTMLVEAMAQTADLLLLSMEAYRGKTPYLMGLGRASFRKPVLPGQTLELRAALTADRPEMGASVCRGQVFVQGELAAEAEIILAMR